jgi:hypothetical protein
MDQDVAADDGIEAAPRFILIDAGLHERKVPQRVLPGTISGGR